MKNNRIHLLPAVLGTLALTLGCSGTGTWTFTESHPAALHYTAPSNLQPDDYYLDVEAGQDTTTLTLKLVSPAAGQSRGVGFLLSADASKVTWTSAGGTDLYLKEGGAFDLGTAPRLFRGRTSGGDLQGGLFQKGATPPVSLNRSTLAYAALRLKDGSPAGAVSLSTTPGIKSESLNASGVMEPINLRIGTLEIR